MSSSASAAPLHLDLRPSARLSALLAAVHLSALAALAHPLELPGGIAPLIALGVLWSLAHSLSRYARFWSSRAVRRLDGFADGGWRLHARDVEWEARLLPDSYLSPGLLVLRFRLQEGGRRNVILLPDMLDAERWRQLQVRLRAGAQPDREAAG